MINKQIRHYNSCFFFLNKILQKTRIRVNFQFYWLINILIFNYRFNLIFFSFFHVKMVIIM